MLEYIKIRPLEPSPTGKLWGYVHARRHDGQGFYVTIEAKGDEANDPRFGNIITSQVEFIESFADCACKQRNLCDRHINAYVPPQGIGIASGRLRDLVNKGQ